MAHYDNNNFPNMATITRTDADGEEFIVKAIWRNDLNYWVVKNPDGSIGSYSKEQIIDMYKGKYNTEQFTYSVDYIN